MENENKPNVIVVREEGSISEQFKNQAEVISYTKDMTPEENQKFVYNCLASKSNSVKEIKDKPFKLKDFVAHEVRFEDKETGEIQKTLRCILVDDKGNRYASTSRGLQNALSKLFGSYGTPDTWSKPMTIIIKEEEKSNGFRYYTIELV